MEPLLSRADLLAIVTTALVVVSLFNVSYSILDFVLKKKFGGD